MIISVTSYSVYKAYVKNISFNNSITNSGPNIDDDSVKKAMDNLNLDV